ncbi:hypothetical protein FGO68_gene8447 [Halteria grandinella]|uniref:MORN repeat protein n=1 Tax=Halteria grandinella TaxID=5974 RepID=A0A8J8T3I2_HALGN|nr:hypothetical protein FGO68_gene8447 [Halteria grandinella]
MKAKILAQVQSKFSEKKQKKWIEFEDSHEWIKIIEHQNSKCDINRLFEQTEFEGKLREVGEPQLLPGEYYGQMKDGKRDGFGIILCIDDQQRGHFYAYEWKEGFPINEGRHVMTDYQLYKFEGILDAELYLTGQGKMIAEDGTEYIGGWKKGKFHGQGILKKKNGWSYFGMWKDNQRHGPGIEIEASGEYCEGKWEENQQVGLKKYYSKEKMLIKTQEQSQK